MKFKRMMLICILLAILTMGAASADDNATSDTLTADENISVPLKEVTRDDIINLEVDKRVRPDVSFGSFAGEHYVTDKPPLWVEFHDEDASGSVAVQVDGVEKANRSLANRTICFDFDEYGSGLKFNTPYNISLAYSGDEKYAPWSVTEVFTLNYIKFERISGLDVDVKQWSTTTLPKDAGGKVFLYVTEAETVEL